MDVGQANLTFYSAGTNATHVCPIGKVFSTTLKTTYISTCNGTSFVRPVADFLCINASKSRVAFKPFFNIHFVFVEWTNCVITYYMTMWHWRDSIAADVFLPLGNRTVNTIQEAADICYSYDQAGLLHISTADEGIRFFALAGNVPAGGTYFTAITRM